MGIHSVRRMALPILISLQPEGLPPIGIDLRDLTYVWRAPLSAFPRDPGVVRFGTYSVESDSPGFVGAALDLDPLLWMIGLNAFRGQRATWLRPDDRYRLKRWPDLDALPQEPVQARAIKALAQGLMSVEKLAARLGGDVVAAQQTVNALSLMSALRRVESGRAAPILPPITAEFEEPARPRGRHVRRGG